MNRPLYVSNTNTNRGSMCWIRSVPTTLFLVVVTMPYIFLYRLSGSISFRRSVARTGGFVDSGVVAQSPKQGGRYMLSGPLASGTVIHVHTLFFCSVRRELFMSDEPHNCCSIS